MHDLVSKYEYSLHFLHYHRFCLGALKIKTRGAQKNTLHFSELCIHRLQRALERQVRSGAVRVEDVVARVEPTAK